jgi:hypothetical protein
MRIREAFLANSAETRQGLAFVLGGFPEWWTVQSLPSGSLLSMVAVAELDESDLDKDFQVTIRMRHPTNETDTLGVAGFKRASTAPRVEGAALRMVLAVPMQVNFRMVGPHEFMVVSGEEIIKQVQLLVKLL